MSLNNYSLNTTRPWLRLFARLFDYCFFYLVVIISLSCTPFFIEDFFEIGVIALLFLMPCLWIPFEAVLIKTFGTTPGKKLFGIKIKNENDANLSLKKSFKRSLMVWMRGVGFGIPILNTICFFIFRRDLKKMGNASWDQKLNIRVYTSKRKRTRALLGTAAFALLLGTIATKQNLYEVSFQSPSSIISYIKEGKFLFDSKIKWVKFKSPEGTFDISFPKKPVTETKQLPIPDSDKTLPITEHTCKHDEDTHFSISYTTLPNSWLKWSSGLVLKGSLKVITKDLGGTKVVYKKNSKFKKHPSLHYTFQKGEKETAGILILIDSTLYKIDMSYTPEKKQEMREYLQTFLESFNPN